MSLNIECLKVSPGYISGWLHLAPSLLRTHLTSSPTSQADPDSSLLAWGLTIKAKNLDLDLRGTKAQVTKVMVSEPRRIEEIKIEINVNKSFDIKIQRLLERAALNCPVAKSLHPDLKQNITFNWPA